MVNAIDVNCVTWGKVSKKHGDFGWQKNIPHYYRRQWVQGRDDYERYHNMYSTPLAAWLSALKKSKKMEFETPEAKSKALSSIKSQITRQRNRKKKTAQTS